MAIISVEGKIDELKGELFSLTGDVNLKKDPQYGSSLAGSIGLCPPQLQNGKSVHAVDLTLGKSLDNNPLPEPSSSPFQIDQIKPLGQVQVDGRYV